MPEASIHRRGEVDLPALLDRIRRELGEEVGALGCFVGIVRGLSNEGERVKFLHYECSREALPQLKKIAAEVERELGLSLVAIHHVIDDLKPREDAIYVIAAGKHRAEVFQALAKVMDRVKSEVQIWKKEITERGEYWV